MNGFKQDFTFYSISNNSGGCSLPFSNDIFISFYTSTGPRKSGILLIELNPIHHDSLTHAGFPTEFFFLKCTKLAMLAVKAYIENSKNNSAKIDPDVYITSS